MSVIFCKFRANFLILHLFALSFGGSGGRSPPEKIFVNLGVFFDILTILTTGGGSWRKFSDLFLTFRYLKKIEVGGGSAVKFFLTSLFYGPLL